MIIYLILLLFC